MGDFNIGLPNYESHHLTEECINTFNFLSFQSLLTKLTRITNHSATLTDHIFSIRSIVTPLAEILFMIFLMIYQTSYYLTVLTIQTSLKKSSNVTIQIVTGTRLLKTSKRLIGLINFIPIR